MAILRVTWGLASPLSEVLDIVRARDRTRSDGAASRATIHPWPAEEQTCHDDPMGVTRDCVSGALSREHMRRGPFPSGIPGCPDFCFWTASILRHRIRIGRHIHRVRRGWGAGEPSIDRFSRICVVTDDSARLDVSIVLLQDTKHFGNSKKPTRAIWILPLFRLRMGCVRKPRGEPPYIADRGH